MAGCGVVRQPAQTRLQRAVRLSELAARIAMAAVCASFTFPIGGTPALVMSEPSALPQWVGPRPDSAVRGAGLPPLAPSRRVTVYNITMSDGSNNTEGLCVQSSDEKLLIQLFLYFVILYLI